VVMVQEVRFPLGARQRVKNELKHLHPEYHYFLEAGKDPLPPDGEGMDTERPKSPWCNRGHFAVATFLHRGVFRSAQRREWHVDADTKTLRHMTRGRVLRVEAELHDGQRLQVFNVHQATSGDMQLQQHTWQILAKSIVECRHHRRLLGGDLNANTSGLRVGYAASNAEHMKRVDDLLAQFVTDTQGELMSPSTVSWRQGSKGAKLDHIVTWNLSHDSNAGSLGACWRSVGTEIPEGCKELDQPALAQRLARTLILTKVADRFQNIAIMGSFQNPFFTIW
jgi:endonuclease/exonuclease/phosphatase family metal-dependent hydrolase